MSNKCDFDCKQDEEIKDNIAFKAEVRTRLKSIEKTLIRLEDDSNREEADVWVAINDLRKDVKSMYWKIGVVSGTLGAATGAIVSIALRG